MPVDPRKHFLEYAHDEWELAKTGSDHKIRAGFVAKLISLAEVLGYITREEYYSIHGTVNLYLENKRKFSSIVSKVDEAFEKMKGK